MSPEGLLLIVILGLLLAERPCPGCGRLLWHRLICPRRRLDRRPWP